MASGRCLTTSRGVVVYSMYDYLNEIKIRPVLWDKDHVNRINRFMDWDDVVRSIVPYFDELPQEEKQDLNSQMMKLWKYTTNLLMKSVKIKFSGDPKYRPYRYTHHMEFYLNSRGISLAEVGTPEEFQENDEIERKLCEKRTKRRAKNKHLTKYTENIDYQEELEGNNMMGPNDSSYDPMVFCETATQDGFNASENVYEYPAEDYNNFETYNGKQEDDPEQDFFDSIKPFLNKLNSAEMLDFKIEFLQILKKYQTQNV